MAEDITTIGEMTAFPLPLEMISSETLVEVEDIRVPASPVGYRMTMAEARQDGNTVPVTSEANFGVAVSGVITTPAFTSYFVKNNVVSANR